MTDNDQGAKLQRAADVACGVLGEQLGTAVAGVLMDHVMDERPDPNIHELAHQIVAAHFRLLGTIHVGGHRVRVFADPNGSGFSGEVMDMPGCFAAGATWTEFAESVAEAVHMWQEHDRTVCGAVAAYQDEGHEHFCGLPPVHVDEPHTCGHDHCNYVWTSPPAKAT